MSQDAKQIIRELVEEVIEEMTGTGAVAGYQTKFAFGKGDRTKKIAKGSMPGGKVVGEKESDDTSMEESAESLPTIRRDVDIMEGRSRYRNFKESDVMRNEAKINLAVQEAKKMLKEINFLLNITERLKVESGVSNKNYLTRTVPNLIEINRQIKEIAKKINRIRK